APGPYSPSRRSPRRGQRKYSSFENNHTSNGHVSTVEAGLPQNPLVDGAGQLFDALLDQGELRGVAQDEEDGVVAGEGAEDFRPFLPVERLGDGLCATGEGADHEQVSGSFRADVERGQEAGEGRRLVPALGGQRV